MGKSIINGGKSYQRVNHSYLLEAGFPSSRQMCKEKHERTQTDG